MNYPPGLIPTELDEFMLEAETLLMNMQETTRLLKSSRPLAQRRDDDEAEASASPSGRPGGSGRDVKRARGSGDEVGASNKASKKQTDSSVSRQFGAPDVASLASACEPCELRPKQFFVAWSGVMTLAWEGFPPKIKALKRKINDAFPELPAENPGSKWAKTTLGCLRDGKRLTPENLKTLARICDEFKDELRATVDGMLRLGDGNVCPSYTSGYIPIDTLSVIVYQCRSLERVLSEHVVNLVSDENIGEGDRKTLRKKDPPSADETSAVDSVMAQFSGPEMVDAYFPDVARDGSRETHYRSTAMGVTLAARVRGGFFLSTVDRFRKAVDEALPGVYTWFEDKSLHCTVRGLVN